jgi:hypothetical protein
VQERVPWFIAIIACKLIVYDNILSRNCPSLLLLRIKYAEKGRVKGSNNKKKEDMHEGRKRP